MGVKTKRTEGSSNFEVGEIVVQGNFDIDCRGGLIQGENVAGFGKFQQGFDFGFHGVLKLDGVVNNGGGIGEFQVLLDVVCEETICTSHKIFVETWILKGFGLLLGQRGSLNPSGCIGLPPKDDRAARPGKVDGFVVGEGVTFSVCGHKDGGFDPVIIGAVFLGEKFVAPLPQLLKSELFAVVGALD